MRKPLTSRQREIYDFIAEEIQHRGIPPTIREVGDRFGMRSSNGAREALNALARKGYIKRHDRLSRGIELVEPVEASDGLVTGRRIPLVKHFPSKALHIHEAPVSRYLIVDSSLLPRDGTPFAVVVQDDGLKPSGFKEGDLAVAVTTPPKADGDVAVVLVGTRLLLRRYRRENAATSLESDRPGEAVLHPNGARPKVRIIGSVRCVMRTFAG